MQLEDKPLYVYLTNSRFVVRQDQDPEELMAISNFVGLGYFVDFMYILNNYSINLLILSTDDKDIDLVTKINENNKKIIMHPSKDIIFICY